MIEVHKVRNGLSPIIMNDVFQFTKLFPMNLDLVTISKEISKLEILAANLFSESSQRVL